MPGSNIKPRTLKIIELHKQGLKVWQIAKAVDAKAPLVVSAIRRAQLRGDIPPPTPKPLASVRDLARVYKTPMGSVGRSMQAGTTSEVWKFAADMTIKGGYDNISEYLIDLLTDAYYENLESKNDDR